MCLTGIRAKRSGGPLPASAALPLSGLARFVLIRRRRPVT